MHDFRAVVRTKLSRLRVGPAREAEIVAELALQMETAYQDAVARGAAEEDALTEAQAPFRDWQALAAEINEAEAVGPQDRMSGTWQDLGYAARLLRRNPGFAAVAVLTLAFGIGGNTAIFTMVDRLVLRSLPYRDSNRLVVVETRKAQQPEIEPWTSMLDYRDLRERSRSFESMAAISPLWNLVMTDRGDAETLSALYTTDDFLSTLGVAPELGRWFRVEENAAGRPAPVVVLSHSLWQRKFGGSRDVLGARVRLDNTLYSVIGVLPASFRYAGEPLAGTAQDSDVWLPLSANQLAGSARSLRFLKITGRLRPGVTVEQARVEVRSLGAELAREYPATDRGYEVDARRLSEQVTGPLRVTGWLLLGSVGFILLMACANVANLLLARAVEREREMSVRVALGASRWRLTRQLLAEGMVLAAAGGLLGVAVAMGGVRVLASLAPASLLAGREMSVDWRALAFTMFTVIAAALLAGAPPAWRVVRDNVEGALRGSGRSVLGGHHRLRPVLVGAQAAVAVALLAGAGLLVRSFERLLEVNPGFDAHNVVTIATQLPSSATTPALRTAVYRTMRDRMLSAPGVMSVGAVSRLPMAGRNLGTWLWAEGQALTREAGYDVEYRVATPTYFETMRIPLRAGRIFDDRDDAHPEAIVLVNETVARKAWPGVDAVGKRIRLGSDPEKQPWLTVIGVVGDVRHSGLDVDPRPEIYRPYAVNPLGAPILVARTKVDAGPLMEPLAAAVRSAAAGMPAYNVSLMEALVDRSTAQRRFVMWLLTGFAGAALLLAGVGVYGTVSQSVAQRTQEIGLRMALGAPRIETMRLVVGQGMRPVMFGIAAGAIAAAGMTRWMRKLLFEVAPLDPLAFGAAAATLVVFAVAACLP